VLALRTGRPSQGGLELKTRARILRQWRRERGLTLVELLVSTVMLIGLMVAALPVIDAAGCHEPMITKQAARIELARSFVERVGRDLRSAYEVVGTPTSTSLTVKTYVRRTACGNDTVSAPDAAALQCQVIWSCASGACTRQEKNPDGTGGGSATALITGLSDNNVFSYSPAPAGATFVGLNVVMPNAVNIGGDAITLRDGIGLRNVPH
jgi:type II secretory pathway pseudopilin PulG